MLESNSEIDTLKSFYFHQIRKDCQEKSSGLVMNKHLTSISVQQSKVGFLHDPKGIDFKPIPFRC